MSAASSSTCPLASLSPKMYHPAQGPIRAIQINELQIGECFSRSVKGIAKTGCCEHFCTIVLNSGARTTQFSLSHHDIQVLYGELSNSKSDEEKKEKVPSHMKLHFFETNQVKETDPKQLETTLALVNQLAAASVRLHVTPVQRTVWEGLSGPTSPSHSPKRSLTQLASKSTTSSQGSTPSTSRSGSPLSFMEVENHQAAHCHRSSHSSSFLAPNRTLNENVGSNNG